jgi:endonuclease/exonuclease/phosphatase family metal-dependent hydrolase
MAKDKQREIDRQAILNSRVNLKISEFEELLGNFQEAQKRGKSVGSQPAWLRQERLKSVKRKINKDIKSLRGFLAGDDSAEVNIENLLNKRYSLIEPQKAGITIGENTIKTGFFNRLAQHFTYAGATDMPYYTGTFQLTNWLGRQMIFSSNDAAEIKRLWTSDFSNIWNAKEPTLPAKIFSTILQCGWALFKTVWNLAKIPLAPIGGVIRITSKVSDMAATLLLLESPQPYTLSVPEAEAPRKVFPQSNTLNAARVETLRNEPPQPNTSRVPEAEVHRNEPPQPNTLRVPKVESSAKASTQINEITTMTLNTALLGSVLQRAGINDIGYQISRERGQKIADYIKNMGAARPDVICLQEVFDNKAQADILKTLKEQYPYAVYKIGNRSWPLMGSGLMILSKYPIKEAGFHRYHNALGDESLANKGFAFAAIDVGNGKSIDVYNTHTQAGSSLGFLKNFFMNRSRGAGDTGERRSEQLGMLARHAESRRDKDGCIGAIACGDVNDSLDSVDKLLGIGHGKNKNSKVGIGHIKAYGRAEFAKEFSGDGKPVPENFVNISISGKIKVIEIKRGKELLARYKINKHNQVEIVDRKSGLIKTMALDAFKNKWKDVDFKEYETNKGIDPTRQQLLDFINEKAKVNSGEASMPTAALAMEANRNAVLVAAERSPLSRASSVKIPLLSGTDADRGKNNHRLLDITLARGLTCTAKNIMVFGNAYDKPKIEKLTDHFAVVSKFQIPATNRGSAPSSKSH